EPAIWDASRTKTRIVTRDGTIAQADCGRGCNNNTYRLLQGTFTRRGRWARVELEQEKEVEEAENYMKKTEVYLDSVMESAMEEYRLFEVEMNRMAMAEHDSLVKVASRKMGKSMKKAATFASNEYIEAAAKSTSSSSNPKKVNPS
ncbi:uncharacterized protein LOC105169149 isoform X1, partial [Olea europaea subsp. europaea]